LTEEEICLRRGSSVLIGGAFEWLFCPEGREFEQANLQKFKCPGGGGGVWNFEIVGRFGPYFFFLHFFFININTKDTIF